MMNADKRDDVGEEDERITHLRESIRHAFPAERFDGSVTNYDDEVSSELTEDQEMLDEDQDLFRVLNGRNWTEVPTQLIENLPDGYGLLSDEAFGAFLAAWLWKSLDNIDGENEVRNFLIYAFTSTARQLRLLSPQQRSVVRSLLVEFSNRGTVPFVRALAAQAVALIDNLE